MGRSFPDCILQSQALEVSDHWPLLFGLREGVHGKQWLCAEAKRCCLVYASLQRTIARLRSRIRVIKDLDANTSFFHRQAGFWKRKNFIPKLVDEGQVITSEEGKQRVMFDYLRASLVQFHLAPTHLTWHSFIGKVSI